MGQVIAVALNDDDVEKLDRLAAALGRSRDRLIEQALTWYVDEQTQQIAAIAAALTEYQSGTATLIAQNEVAAHMEKLLRRADQP